jgi:hypothetical protein
MQAARAGAVNAAEARAPGMTLYQRAVQTEVTRPEPLALRRQQAQRSTPTMTVTLAVQPLPARESPQASPGSRRAHQTDHTTVGVDLTAHSDRSPVDRPAVSPRPGQWYRGPILAAIAPGSHLARAPSAVPHS